MSPRLIVVKKGLELSHSALLQLDNTFNSFNFAFSITTIITHFFDLVSFSKYTQIEGRTGRTPLWGVLFRHAKNIRICSSWEFGFRLREVDLFTTFRFQKQAGIQGSVLTYITIADAIVK